jgi:hypothetical protein
MPGTGSYILGSASSDYRNTIDELLSQLPDNSANLIIAKDIRDSVWTLWNRIDDVEITSNQAASFSSLYENTNPVPVTIGGISSGTVFEEPKTMKQMFDMLLYPYIAPGGSLSIVGTSNREYGSSTSFTLSWSITVNTKPITSIIVDGLFIYSGTSGTKSTTGTHSLTPGISQTNTFTMTVSDGQSTINRNATLTWMNKRFWGSVDLSSLGNPNLTSNPSMSTSVGNSITSLTIRNLDGANANGQNFGNELSNSRLKTYNNINGDGKYLIFAFPSNFGTPSFSVNGLPNTAFTKVKTFAFTNSFGFSGTNYDVWISNTLQNAALNIIIN